MNRLPCDVSRCTADNCQLKQYCARYTAPTKNCAQVVMMGSEDCIKNNNIEYINNGRLDAPKKS